MRGNIARGNVCYHSSKRNAATGMPLCFIKRVCVLFALVVLSGKSAGNSGLGGYIDKWGNPGVNDVVTV